MRIVGMIFLSGLAWLVITLITAATVEITMGERRSGLIHLLTMAAWVPTLFLIWRRRKDKAN